MEPVPQVDLRQRRIRAAHQRQPQARRARCDRRVGTAPRRPLGRGQGPAARECPGALGRPATAAVHRARAGERSAGAAARRTRVGARSDRDAEDRGARLRAQARAHDRHRDAQPAAGGAHLRPDGLLLPGPARRDGRHAAAVHQPARAAHRGVHHGEVRMSANVPFRHFHDQLTALNRRLLAMSERAEALIELSVDALLNKDQAKAEAVIAGDREVDAMEVEIEAAALELLALQQPMARDLRFIIGAIKVTSDLERIGDHAVNIAQTAQRLVALRTTITPDPEIEDMARRARAMLGDSIDAFLRADGALGRDVCARDDQVDALHESVFRILLTHMMADPRTINPSLEYLLVSRNLERVADLATNIGEDAVFLAEGKNIKHGGGAVAVGG